MGDTGLEPPFVTTNSTNDLRQAPVPSGAKSGAVGSDPSFAHDLAKVIAGWNDLAADSRARILAIVQKGIGQSADSTDHS